MRFLSSLMALTRANTATATIRKLIRLLMKVPMFMVTASYPLPGTPQRDLDVGEIHSAQQQADRRHDHILDQRAYDGAEGAADDDADGHVHHIALEGELL